MTPRQKDTLEFIAGFLAKNGYAPSFEEIAEGIGVKSMATGHKHVKLLEHGGFIRMRFNQSRSIELTPKGRALLNGKPDFRVSVSGRFSLTVVTEKGRLEEAGEVSDLPAALEKAKGLLT